MTAQAREPAPAPVRVRLPVLFTGLFPTAERQVDLQAGSVREVIDALDARWPGMRDRLCDTRPAIRPHINVFVNGRRVPLDTPLEPGTDVFIITAVSGG